MYYIAGADASLLVFARELFQLLFARAHQVLHGETTLAVLKTLEQHCPRVGTEITQWVLRADDGPRLHPEVGWAFFVY